MECLSQRSDGTVEVLIYVQPRSSRNAIAGLHDGALKLAVTSPPVDGKANMAVMAFLADIFRIPKRDVSLLRGQSSRRKTFLIQGKSMEELRVCIEPNIRD